jgi:uncharacterized protein DUF6084
MSAADTALPGATVDLAFSCDEVVADRYAASPTVVLRMRARDASGLRVHALALRCQVRIEPVRRPYNDGEETKVVDLFGTRGRWGATMQPLQLAFLSQVLPGFTGECTFDLALPVSYDVDVAAHKYLAALEDGDVPLLLLFSGQVFTGSAGAIAVQPVPWHKETTARLPVAVWREAVDAHFPGQAWLRVDRETFDRLSVYRGRLGLTSFDAALDRLLGEAER